MSLPIVAVGLLEVADMSMMGNMRSGTDSTFMQVVMVLIVVSFVAWGIAPQGDTTSTVVTVNGHGITGIEYNRLLRQAQRSMESRIEGSLTEDDEAALRDNVRTTLIETEVLRQEALAMGLEVSDSEVARELLGISRFLDEEGRFSERFYGNYLRQAGFTRPDFEEQIREDLLLRKLRLLVFMGATISDPIVRETYVEENTQIDIEYVRVNPSAFNALVAISPPELETWLGENAESVQELYEQDFERKYNIPEKIRGKVLTLMLKGDGLGVTELRPKMDAILAELQAGADFSEMARKWSEDPTAVKGGDFGVATVTQLGTMVVQALVNVEPDHLSDVVVTDTDLRVYYVEERFPAKVIALDTVEQEIADAIMREQLAPVRAAEFAEQELLSTWREAGGAPVDMVASVGLEIGTTGPVALTGVGAFPRPPVEMLKAAGDSEIGGVFPDVYEENGILWVGQLSDRIAADMTRFEENGDRIREQALSKLRADFFSGWKADAIARAIIE